MKILSTFFDLDHMALLSAYADGFLVGNDQFGTRLCKSFSQKELILAIDRSIELKKEIFLVFNQIMNDQELEGFETFVKELPLEKVNGIVVGDLGAIQLLSELGCSKKVIYNPETLITNTYDFNMMADLGIKGLYVAKEITLDELIDIGRHRELELFMVGHGHLNMFYSKRQLIENYMEHLGDQHQDHNRQDLRLIEETRPLDQYPILEDQAGTHVFRSNVMHSAHKIEALKPYVDYLVIDTIFKNDAYALAILPMYQKGQLDLEIKRQIESLYHETWDEGFFYKKTIYKTKG